MASDLYYNGTQTWATTDSASSTTYSTTASPYQTWYYYNEVGELIQGEQPPEHTHGLPNNGSWTIQQPPTDHGIWVDGEQVMKFNDDVHVKIDGDWVSVKDLNLRIKTLEIITEKLYNLLPVWQRNILNMDEIELEDKDDEFEHFDPDLFKV